VEPLAPHEAVFVDKAWFTDDPVHGSLECVFCHSGNPDDSDWRTAHDGVYRDPSWDNLDASCGLCHGEIASGFKTSLHATLKPYERVIEMRATRDRVKFETVDMARETHCGSCHSSCGQCHISRPTGVGGGLLASHNIKKRPPMRETCTACHGSRVEKEFFGLNEGVPADVHRTKYMACGSCHSADEMHGDGVEYEDRYAVADRAKCLSCHDGIYETGDNVSQHVMHQEKVSCQVCHAMPYKNCYSCHVAKDILDLPYFRTESTEMGFKIGFNPLQSDERPEKYSIVRHIPIDHGLFEFYVEDALPNFDVLPTWKFATPHTIQRSTPQNESCGSCHGNRELFLQESDVLPEYLEANRDVIVPDDRVPRPMGN